MISFEILGKVQAKQRPRLAKGGFVYTPKNTIMYENLVKLSFQNEYSDHIPYEGLLKVKIKAYFEIPKSYTKKRRKEIEENNNYFSSKPDTDNIAKSILDSLNGIAYKDDSQIVELKVEKYYGEMAKAKVEIEEIGR